MSLCGALVAAEFSARYPHTGGLYVYLEKIYGNKISFLFGWMNTLIYTPAILSALSVLFADQVSSMLNANQMMHDILALSILTAIVIINFSNPTDSIFSILVTILGLPVYVIFVKKKN
ncbi:amino acid permease [Caldicellulosiruptor bescii]|jgi:APA family basic amino acid/polyamine antiporter|nr:amino acid permease [Caldicellulosiruptor bescii]